jgi:excinuclease UvrABC ATPase subunit
MGLFSRKEEKGKDAVPTLPELPPLPVLPDLEGEQEELPKLPGSQKSDSKKEFSPNDIKKAINGKKEEEEEISEEDDFVEHKGQMIQESPRREFQYVQPRNFTKERFSEEGEKVSDYGYSKKRTNKEVPEGFEEAERKVKESEPIFIRIDKFEESRKVLQRAKMQILEIENTLNRIKSIKQEEDRELESWEQEILNIKDRISHVEENLFSKL